MRSFRNSSKPPSSDGLKRKTKCLQAKSDRKPGGQLGHRGETQHLVATADEQTASLRPVGLGREEADRDWHEDEEQTTPKQRLCPWRAGARSNISRRDDEQPDSSDEREEGERSELAGRRPW
jgi:hypothetical protein